MVRAGDALQLLGRVEIHMQTRLVTGLHIGAGSQAISVGGLDNPVVRHPLSGEPYIPGSSLKGRMRALLERLHALEMGQRINQVWIHSCWPVGILDKETRDRMQREAASKYRRCPVCRVFGVAAEAQMGNLPTRLLVDDAFLTDESKEELAGAETDLLYTEVKWEASIDRVTSAANPRPMERVPAGAIFAGPNLRLSFYAFSDGYRDPVALLDTVLLGLRLVADEGLGGSISRGYGRVAFEGLQVLCRPPAYYTDDPGAERRWAFKDLNELWGQRRELLREVAQTLALPDEERA